MKKLTMLFLFFLSCASTIKDTFNSKELISSKGEKIYINSLNWGATDDYQMSIISSNKYRVKERIDTSGVIEGLEPFFYSFNKDTLKLYFDTKVIYSVKEEFKTIKVNYIALSKSEYKKIRKKSFENIDYFSVPETKKVKYPSDMPKAPR